MVMHQFPTKLCQTEKIRPPSHLHPITLSPPKGWCVLTQGSGSQNTFCNYGGSLMKDPGKWSGSIDYQNIIREPRKEQPWKEYPWKE